MDKKWNVWLYPLGCLVVVLVLLVFVFTSTGCNPPNLIGDSNNTAYASEATSDTSKQIYVCSHLGIESRKGQIEFDKYSSVIWVEPVTQNIFSVYYSTIDTYPMQDQLCRAISGPLLINGTSMTFKHYQKLAEASDYTLIYE